jgi:hypothetical protein
MFHLKPNLMPILIIRKINRNSKHLYQKIKLGKMNRTKDQEFLQ